jgi:hypothetical protein
VSKHYKSQIKGGISRNIYLDVVKYVSTILLISLIFITCACTFTKKSGIDDTWQDNFDDNKGWQLSADASATVSIYDGKLIIEVHEPGQVAWSAHESVWDNFEMTVVTEQLAGPLDNEYGLLLRMDNDTDFYVFSVSGDGYTRAALFQDELWTVLGSDWTPNDNINQGLSANTLSVTALDTTFTLSVNGAEVLKIDDETLSSGSIGLYAGAFGEGGVVVAFDDLNVTALP